MTTDPTTIPVGTATLVTYKSGDRSLWFHKGLGVFTPNADSLGGVGMTDSGRSFTPLVPVPDGMTVDDAQRALTEHVAWVPLPRERWKDIHVGARVRIVGASGDVFLVTTIRRHDRYIVTGDYLYGGAETESVFIHPDDVPTDPDAELIEAMALSLWNGNDHLGWGHADEATRDLYRDKARAALAVVRKHDEATR